MSQTSSGSPAATTDPVSNVLKWILLAVAVVTFALLGWATFFTYERAQPHPERFVGASGAPLMTADDILVGKAGFQKADPMLACSLRRQSPVDARLADQISWWTCCSGSRWSSLPAR